MTYTDTGRITRRPDRRRRLVGILVTLVALAACVVAAADIAGPAPHDAHPVVATAVDAPKAEAAISLPTCGGGATDAPLTVPLWCGSAQQLENLSWSGWGSSTASATGDLRDTTCFCVGAATRDYPVVVRLSTVGQSHRYTALSISFPQARPQWAYLPAFRFAWTPQGFVSEDSAS